MSSRRLRLAKRHLMSWGTGRGDIVRADARDRSATVVLDDAGHLDLLLGSDLVGAGTMVFCPSDVAVPSGGQSGSSGAGPTIVGYQGSAREPDGDLSIDDEFFLQIQDYATSEYMSVIGATLVRITGEDDFEAFLADADRASGQGRFAAFLTEPAVQLADLAALGGPARSDGPHTRLHVGPDGDVSISTGGCRLGGLGDSLALIEAQWARVNGASVHPCAVAIGAIVPEEVRTAALRDRPWLGRYLGALDAVRELHARGIADVRVSGFGERLAAGAADAAQPLDLTDASLPLLLWCSDAAYLHSPGAGRTFLLDPTVGAVAEAVLVHGAAGAAEQAGTRQVARVETLFADVGIPLTAGEAVGAGR